MTTAHSPSISFPFTFHDTHRISREIRKTLANFWINLFTIKLFLSFKTYREDIYTSLLIGEHHDFYL